MPNETETWIENYPVPALSDALHDGEIPLRTEEGMRDFMSAFPTGVAVVATVGRDGQPYGLTCSSVTSVTLTPPTILVCLRQNAGGALSVVLDRGAFAVNLLHDGASTTAELLSRTAADRFANLSWRPSPLLGVPWLEGDTHATSECRVSGTVDRGDHTIVFGEVVGTSQRDGNPLLYGYRKFSSWRHVERSAKVSGDR